MALVRTPTLDTITQAPTSPEPKTKQLLDPGAEAFHYCLNKLWSLVRNAEDRLFVITLQAHKVAKLRRYDPEAFKDAIDYVNTIWPRNKSKQDAIYVIRSAWDLY
ncbi:hypothetical protein P9112_011783 [Eukaryota sp. TZLM1-RC]